MCGRVLDRADGVFAPLELFRPAHNDVLRDANIVQRHPDLQLFGSLGTLDGHHHKQVHVAVRSCLTARVRTKEYDLVRGEVRYDSSDHAIDLLSYRLLCSDHVLSSPAQAQQQQRLPSNSAD